MGLLGTHVVVGFFFINYMIFGKADEFEDTKGVIRIRKWPNDKDKRPNNDLQNIKHKNKRSSNIIEVIYIDI